MNIIFYKFDFLLLDVQSLGQFGGRVRAVLLVDVSQKHGVDEGRFAQAWLTNDHQTELKAFFDGFPAIQRRIKMMTVCKS